MEYLARSLGLDVRELDHLCPLFDFRSVELSVVDRRECEHGATQVGKARLDLGIDEGKTSGFAPSSSWTRVDQLGNFLEVRDRITRTRRLGEQVELLILSFPDRHQRQVCVGLRLGRERDHYGGDRKPADCPGQKHVQLECLPNIAWPKNKRVLARQARAALRWMLVT